MRAENKAMSEYLRAHGFEGVKARYIEKGSLKGCWSLSGKLVDLWREQDARTLNGLGFWGFDGKPLHMFSGNGGMWQVFVRGHYEMLKENKNDRI